MTNAQIILFIKKPNFICKLNVLRYLRIFIMHTMCNITNINLLNNINDEFNDYVIYKIDEPLNGSVAHGRRTFVNLSKTYDYKNLADLIINPIVVIKLNNFDLEFDSSNVFKNIELEIGGTRIDKIYSNQINLYMSKYNLKSQRIGSKVFIPIPIESLLNGLLASKLKYMDIRIFFEFVDMKHIDCIEEFQVSYDLVKFSKEPNYKKISSDALSHMCYKNKTTQRYGQKCLQHSTFGNFESEQIVLIKQNQYTGEQNLNGFDNLKINTSFNHGIENFYIYFENIESSIIYKNKPFEQIEFIVNGYTTISMDYETLAYTSNLINPNLPKGMYQIEWKKYYNDVNPDSLIIQLKEISIPSSDICFNICAESYNYLHYGSGVCSFIFSN